MQIRVLTSRDILATSYLLVNTLNGSLLQKLGRQFTKKYFLPYAIRQEGLAHYVCEYNGKIIGYLLFAQNQTKMQYLGKALIPVIVIYLLLRGWFYPSLLVDLSTSFYNKSVLLSVGEEEITNATYLVYLAIDSSFQSKGMGSHALVRCLEKLSPNRCIVEASDPRVIKFYKKHDFKTVGYRKRFFASYELLLRTFSY